VWPLRHGGRCDDDSDGGGVGGGGLAASLRLLRRTLWKKREENGGEMPSEPKQMSESPIFIFVFIFRSYAWSRAMWNCLTREFGFT
jgi:hypothetical protein